jgi:hypothetical protein
MQLSKYKRSCPVLITGQAVNEIIIKFTKYFEFRPTLEVDPTFSISPLEKRKVRELITPKALITNYGLTSYEWHDRDIFDVQSYFQFLRTLTAHSQLPSNLFVSPVPTLLHLDYLRTHQFEIRFQTQEYFNTSSESPTCRFF